MNILINLKYTLAVTAGVCSSFAYAQKHPHIILMVEKAIKKGLFHTEQAFFYMHVSEIIHPNSLLPVKM